MDPRVRQSQRIQAGIEATQDAVNPGWLLQLNSNNTVGSVNVHDGYTHYTSEAAADNNQVLTQDRRIYTALTNSGLYSSSTQQNVGTYMKAALALNPVAYWRLGETGNNRVAVDLVAGQQVNLMPNSGFESGLGGWTGWSWWPTAVAQSRQEAHSGEYSLALFTPVNPTHTGATGAQTPFSPVSGQTYSLSFWFLPTVSGSYNFAAQDGSSNWVFNSGARNLVAGVWSQVTISGFVPTNGNLLFIAVFGSTSLLNGQTHYIDDVVLVYGSVAPTSYFAGGSGSNTLPNLIPNPSFEADTAGWSNTTVSASISQSTAQAHSGSGSMFITGTLPGSGFGEIAAVSSQGTVAIPCSPGQTMSASAQFYPTVLATGINPRIYIRWLDSAGNNTLGNIPSPSAALTLNTWQKLSVTGTAPAGTAYVSIVVQFAVTGSSAGQSAAGYIDEVMCVVGPTMPASFYEGNGGNDGDYIGGFVPNLLSAANPLTANSNLTGWGDIGGHINAGATRSWVTTAPLNIGTGEMQIVTTATANEGAAAQVTGSSFTSGVPLTASVYLRGNVGGETILLVLGASGVDTATQSVVLTTSWVRYSVVWTPTANETQVFFTIRNTAANVSTWFANAAQVTNTPNPVPYSDTTGIQLGQAGAVSSGGDTDTAVLFDGQSGYVNVGNPTPLQLVVGSIACWAKTSSASTAFRAIVVKQNAWGIFTDNVHWGFYDWGAGTFRDSGVVANDGNWHHLVLTFQSGVTNGSVLYIDGIARLTSTMTVSSQGIALQVGGAGSPNTAQYWSGTIDEPTIYNYVLSAAQVSTLYAAR